VRDSDGTVIFSVGVRLTGGSALTAKVAAKYKRPWLHLHGTNRTNGTHGRRKEYFGGREAARAARLLTQFVQKWNIRVLNIAGPRQSQEPGVGDFVREVLGRVLD
jgi:hypothetical protein